MAKMTVRERLEVVWAAYGRGVIAFCSATRRSKVGPNLPEPIESLTGCSVPMLKQDGVVWDCCARHHWAAWIPLV
jgi:hypothetical protein